MAAPASSTAGTAVPPQNAFPPFDTTTYPGQIFWLAITFTVLFVVLWRVAGPRIASVIRERKGRIDGDLAAAEKHRSDAEATLAGYQAKLADARAKAHALAEETRKASEAEADKLRAEAEASAREAQTKAEAEIAAMRATAAQHVTKAAQDAAAAIVARLIGDTISPAEAETAVKATGN